MRTSKIIRDQRSVLKTDTFEKRRFQGVFEMSEGLQRIRDASDLPTIEPLLQDIWASFYKMKPMIVRSRLDRDLDINRTIMKQVMRHEQFERFRMYTKLNILTAAIFTEIMGEKLNQWLAEELAANREGGLQGVSVKNGQAEVSDETESEIEELEDGFEEETIVFNEKLELAIELNPQRFANRIGEAMDEALHTKESLVSLMGGTGVGKGDAELKKVPLREKLMIAEKIATDLQMKNIAEWAGHFTRIALKKSHTTYIDAAERRGVVQGKDVERLLPSELGMYKHPVAKKAFLRKFAEGETMQYDQKKRDYTGRGPIVFCFDQSGSMSELDTQAKGFVIALLSIAKKQNRDLCVLLFSTEVQRFTFKKGRMTSRELIHMAETYLGGGTDYSLALEHALAVLAESEFSRADILFVTDGENDVSEEFLQRFIDKKSEKNVQVLSLLMGTTSTAVEGFSDRVMHVTDFDEAGSYSLFEI
ncbi:vWA domain-containing protein [Sporosarcina sp. ITBMC105]